MTYNEFVNHVLGLFPNAVIDEDALGELVITTGLRIAAPPTAALGEAVSLADCDVVSIS